MVIRIMVKCSGLMIHTDDVSRPIPVLFMKSGKLQSKTEPPQRVVIQPAHSFNLTLIKNNYRDRKSQTANKKCKDT